jgi:hypothetical protein
MDLILPTDKADPVAAALRDCRRAERATGRGTHALTGAEACHHGFGTEACHHGFGKADLER